MKAHLKVTAIAVVSAIIITMMHSIISGSVTTSAVMAFRYYGLCTVISVLFWNIIYAKLIKYDRSNWSIFMISLWLPIIATFCVFPPFGIFEFFEYFWLIIPCTFATGLLIAKIVK
jgi:hypothetical protein